MTKWRSGVLNNPRPDDPQWDTAKEAQQAAFEQSKRSSSIYAVWAPDDSIDILFYEGEAFRPS